MPNSALEAIGTEASDAKIDAVTQRGRRGRGAAEVPPRLLYEDYATI